MPRVNNFKVCIAVGCCIAAGLDHTWARFCPTPVACLLISPFILVQGETPGCCCWCNLFDMKIQHLKIT